MAMENGPFEDVFPIEHGDFPASYVSCSRSVHQKSLCVLEAVMDGTNSDNITLPETNLAPEK